MNTMCCEVSYLYIGLLTQLSYLIYVGFLNKPEQSKGFSKFKSKISPNPNPTENKDWDSQYVMLTNGPKCFRCHGFVT